MMNTVRLQWLGKSIGFEKVSLKKNILRGYFLANQQSPYFESSSFHKILQFVQDNPRRCNLKEVKSSLRISFEAIKTINEAVEILEEMAGQPAVA
ncbi:hypothetical protein EON73_05850, partial [bacterium]